MPQSTLKSVQSETTLIWHGVNDSLNLQLFLDSPIEWGETDVCLYGKGDKEDLVCRHDSFEDISDLHKTFPKSIIQTQISLTWMRQEMPADQEKLFYDQIKKPGIEWISISWKDHPQSKEVERIRRAGFSLNLYHVNTLEAIEQAMTFKPETLTSDFNIPEWGLKGRGSGEKKTVSLKGMDKHFVKKDSS